MKNEQLLKGIYSAIFSVYDENGNVLYDTVKKMVDFQLDNGLQGFYVCGNTGECTILPNRTRKQMLEAVIKANEGRGQVICHVGAGHIDDVYDLIEHANEQKIDAIASLPPSLTPYYAQEESIAYYKDLAARSKHPVYAYITPVLRGDVVAFAKELMAIPNVAGIKLTISDYYSFGRIMSIDDGNVNVLNGPDETMLCGLAMGAQGAIGTTYNFIPDLATDIYNAYRANDMEKARESQKRLQKFVEIGLGHNLSYWKAFMTLMGFDMGATMFPGKSVTKEELCVLKEKLIEIGFNKVV